jgi:hypothetical protein
MPTQDDSPPQIKDLPTNAKSAVEDCGQVLSNEDKFETLRIGDESSGQYDLWFDNEGLIEISRPLVNLISPLIRVHYLRCSMYRNRF